MRGNSDQKLRPARLSHHLRRQRLRGQMHTIRAGCASDVRSIVYEQPRAGTSSNLDGASDEFIQRSPTQSLFAYLKKRDFGVYCRLDQTEDLVRTVRLAARYRVDDRQWKIEQHRSSTYAWDSSGFAKQRPYV